MVLIWNWLWFLDNTKLKVLCFYSSLVLMDKALISQVLTLIQDVWEKLGYHAHA